MKTDAAGADLTTPCPMPTCPVPSASFRPFYSQGKGEAQLGWERHCLLPWLWSPAGQFLWTPGLKSRNDVQ